MTTPTPPPVILLPGLAANLRLFTPQLTAFDTAFVPAWPNPEEHTPTPRTLDDHAAQLHAQLHAEQRLDPRPVIVGFSFGGQVALSLTNHAIENNLPAPRAIVLVSAPRSAKQLTPAFMRRAAAITALPAPLVSLAARSFLTRAFAKSLSLNKQLTEELKDMAREIDVPLLKQHARLSRAWDRTTAQHDAIAQAAIPVHHIHANEDPVIPPPPPDTPNLTRIPGKAHLLTWTHTDQVNALIEQAIATPAA